MSTGNDRAGFLVSAKQFSVDHAFFVDEEIHQIESMITFFTHSRMSRFQTIRLLFSVACMDVTGGNVSLCRKYLQNTLHWLPVNTRVKLFFLSRPFTAHAL